jgi:hypothetical protein
VLLTINQVANDEFTVEGDGCSLVARTKAKAPLALELSGVQRCTLPRRTSDRIAGTSSATRCAFKLTMNDATLSVTAGVLTVSGVGTVTPAEASCSPPGRGRSRTAGGRRLEARPRSAHAGGRSRLSDRQGRA